MSDFYRSHSRGRFQSRPRIAPGLVQPSTRQVPLGIFVVLPNDNNGQDPSTQPCWTDPNVRGVTLRSLWTSIHPTQTGGFDWSYFDTGFALAKTNNKWIQLQIGAGTASPTWVYTAGAQTWNVSGQGNMPPPWDSTFLHLWSKVQNACAARYDADPLLTSVTLSGPGHSIECFFAQDPGDVSRLDAIGGAPVWQGGANAVIDLYMAAWQSTPQIYIAVGDAYPDGNVSMGTVVSYGLRSYGTRFGIQSNALSSTFPATGATDFPHTNVAFSSLSRIGYQLKQPLNTLMVPLSACVAQGQGAKWIQIYPNDPLYAGSEATMATFNASVGAVAP